MTLTNPKNQNRSELVFLLIFGAVFAFLLWKCRFGFAYDDESFYLTTPLRLWQGDALFVHEWHLSQMSSLLLLPFVAAFMTLHGATEGIILTFRYLFTVIQAITALFLYFRLKKTSCLGAAVAALCFLIYTPFCIMALSYNSMGLITLALSVVILLTAKTKRSAQLVFSGFFLACSVLCCPYLVLAYVYFAAAALIAHFLHKEHALSDLLWMTVGCAITAAAFGCFVFSRASLGQILDAFPLIFQDPEHEARSASNLISEYLFAIIYSGGPYSLLLDAGMAAGFLAGLADRRKRFSVPLFLFGAMLALGYLVTQISDDPYLNYFMFPLNMFAFYCLPLTRDKRIFSIFTAVFIPGMIYSFCIHCTSNQVFLVIASASAVSLLGSILIIVLTAKDLLTHCDGKKVCTALICGALCVLFLFQLGAELFYRYSLVFPVRQMPQQTAYVAEGPEKGLWVNPDIAGEYTHLYQTITSNAAYRSADSVLFLTKHTWMFLFDNKNSSAYSGWMSGVNSASVQRLNAYYTLNPDKIPDFIYVDAKDLDIAEKLEILPRYQLISSENEIIWSIK